MKFLKLLLPLTLIFLSSCAQNDYFKSNLIELEDFFMQKETTYGVYYFKEGCPNCTNTAPYITGYLDKLTRNADRDFYLDNIYFIDAVTDPIEKYLDGTNKDRYRNTQIGNSNLETLTTMGYPQLFILSKSENKTTISDIRVGEKEITEYIKTIW